MTTPDEEALARNDRYLREFVEGLRMCPYARVCREGGKLLRRVLRSREQALPAIAGLEALPKESVEVALFIFPGEPATGEASARAFQSFCAGVRDQMFARHRGEPPFYAVAFHPALPRDLSDANRAVQLVRRSPDPTLQLVRASVLRSVRGHDDGGSRYVDTSKLTLEQAMALVSPLTLAERIAQANLNTLQRMGPDEVEALLASFRRHHP
ncbi:MAG TPA: DUF1415 family protein [Myxococcales bacterium]|nr:DUF1415 family protein [Myxococcales bacterium]